MKSLETKRQEKFAAMAQLAPCIAGSLCRVERKDKDGNAAVYHLLTCKEGGKTKSVYVPKDMVKEVERWIRNYRRIKKLLAEVSGLGTEIIQGYVPGKRAAAGSRRGAPSRR